MATIDVLAASPEPNAVAATRMVLTDPTIPPMMFGGIWRCNEGVWEAWQERRHPLLLAALAKCGDKRAIEPLAEALRDPDLPDDERGQLVSSASFQFRDDPRLIAAVIAASTFQSSFARVHTAGTLLGLGATDEAIAMYRDAAIELGVDGWGQSESALGRMTDPAAGEALLAIVDANPTAAAIDALGWHPSPAAVDAIVPRLDDPAMHLAGIDALETNGHARGDRGAGAPLGGGGRHRDTRSRPSARSAGVWRPCSSSSRPPMPRRPSAAPTACGTCATTAPPKQLLRRRRPRRPRRRGLCGACPDLDGLAAHARGARPAGKEPGRAGARAWPALGGELGPSVAERG